MESPLFEVSSDIEIKDFKNYLNKNIFQQFDKLVLYADSQSFTRHNNLNGVITISDDGLFYFEKNQVGKNDITLDQLTKLVESTGIQDLNMDSEPEEKTLNIEELKNILINLKNYKIKEIGDQKVWIYIEIEEHTNLELVKEVLTLLKFLKVSHKSFHGKY